MVILGLLAATDQRNSGKPLWIPQAVLTRPSLAICSRCEDTPALVRKTVGAREHHGVMAAPTVEAAIHELMDLAWNLVYDLLEERELLGDGLFVEEYTGIHSWWRA